MNTKQLISMAIIMGLIAVSNCWAGDADKGGEPALNPVLAAHGSVVEKVPSPMGRAFEDFHFETILDCMTEVMGGIRDYSAKAHPDRPPVVLSGNPAGGMHLPRWVEEAAPFDYFNIECDVVHLHEDKALGHFLAIAALAESVDTTLLVMPDAQSNKKWNQREDPQAYAGATGLSYALGGHMHVPWCLYDGSQYTRFYGSLEGHQPIFRMIQDHADWFDGYVSALWHVLEVPYGEEGVAGLKALEPRIRSLFDAGVPTVLRLKGEDVPMAAERFSGEPRLQSTFDPGRKLAPLDSPFEMNSAFRSVFLPPVPRVQHQASKTPLVLHLIQRFGNQTTPSGEGSITIARDLLQGAEVTKVEIAAPEWPDTTTASVTWKTNNRGDLELAVKNVPAWALLRIHTAEPVKLPGIERAVLRKAMVESEIPLMRMIRFSDVWQRPQWVDDAIASDTDPLDGYHVTRISWSYDHSLQTLKYAEDNSMAFHGSDTFLHTYMALDGKPHQEGIPTFKPEWPGWARYPDGHPMHIRPDFLPVRYGSSFASPEYRKAMIERANAWYDKGAAGIQFDDISGMVNRVWQYGGDFSDAFFTGFRSYLVEQGFDGVTADTPLDALRERVMAEMKYRPAYERRPDGSVVVGEPASGYPGLVWVGPIEAFPISDDSFATKVEFRMTKGDLKGIELLLMDGDHTVYLSRVPLADILPADASNGDWISLRVHHDLKAQTTRIAVGKNGKWGEARPFDMPLPAAAKSLSPALMINPLSCSVEVRKIKKEDI